MVEGLKKFGATLLKGARRVFAFIMLDKNPPKLTRKQLVLRMVYKTLLFWFVFSYFEFILHFVTIGNFTWKFIYPVILSLPLAVLAAALTSTFRTWLNYLLSWAVMLAAYLFIGAQLVYYKIFGSYISFSLMRMGGQAIKNFWPEVHTATVVNWRPLLVMAIPMLLYGLIVIFKPHIHFDFHRRTVKQQLVAYGALIPAYLVSIATLFFGGTGSYSPYDAYFNSDTTTEFSLNTLGALSTMMLELAGSSRQGDIGDTLSGGETSSQVEQKPPVDLSKYNPDEYNMLDIDFAALDDATDDENIKTLNRYFSSVVPSAKNEYTGIFKGYNLISLCAESFCPYLIDPVVTPTLYKLANGGFVFNNYYNSYQSVTTNGEYTYCMGLFPDLSRNKKDGSFKASSSNLVPFCMGNMFATEGVAAHGYHNYRGTYYSRRTSHPNMGYTMKFMDDGMTFTTSWPTSDLEMMEQSVDDYINEDRFHAYYMTFSGHYRYSFVANPMCRRNKELAEQLLEGRGYSEPIVAYYACNLELEKALTYLMGRLEDAGVLDKTVIVLAGDHYPYGLNFNQYNELAGHTVDTKFEKFESTLICYNSAMDPVTVDTPCSTQDVLPTLLNLFGFEFDSRMLAGTDIFADNREHMAILSSQSFITDEVKFDSGSNEATYLVPKNTLPKNYLKDHIQAVKQIMTLSSGILDNDYYRFVYEASGFEMPETASSGYSYTS